jgi:hypothetical protein
MEAALRRVAVHEAGHAVAACALRLLVREVLIRDDGRGHVAYYPVPISHSNIARRAVASYAGPARSASASATRVPLAIWHGSGSASTSSAWTGNASEMERHAARLGRINFMLDAKTREAGPGKPARVMPGPAPRAVFRLRFQEACRPTAICHHPRAAATAGETAGALFHRFAVR